MGKWGLMGCGTYPTGGIGCLYGGRDNAGELFFEVKDQPEREEGEKDQGTQEL